MTAPGQHVERFRLSPELRSIAQRAYRCIFALIGSYFLTAAYVTFGAVSLPMFGMNPGEAAFIGILSGFFIYVGAAIWVASTKRLLVITVIVISLTLALRTAAPIIYSAGA